MIKGIQVVFCLLSTLTLTACGQEMTKNARDAVLTPPTHAQVALSAQTTACLQAYGVSYERLAAQFRLFQAAVKKDNPSEASTLISYPLRVNVIKNGQHMSQFIKNTAQLTMGWPKLLNASVKQKILAAESDRHHMICNDMGIGFADGLVWFYGDHNAQIDVLNAIVSI
jgi:hypothetical protein